MAVEATPTRAPISLRGRTGYGDLGLKGISLGATLVTLALIFAIGWKIIHLARLSLGHFGFSFLWHQDWNTVTDKYGALDFLFATALTSFLALLIATPIAVAIGLYLTQLAPKRLRTPIGALVETLAGIPSVVIGLWGIIVLGPVVRHQFGPVLGTVFGWTPFFPKQDQYPEAGILSAVIVLVIMTVPIVSSVARELFTRVPHDLQDGSMALGATRWETIKGVVLPYVGPGLLAAAVLGLGRAIGEAIAVTQVIGSTTNGISFNLFHTGDTMASRIAAQYQGAVTLLQASSLAYLALVLFVLSLIFNLIALTIIRRVEKKRR
jgi:phosphate transport system permease protein